MKAKIKIFATVLIGAFCLSFSPKADLIVEKDDLLVYGHIAYIDGNGCYNAYSCLDQQYYSFEDPDGNIQSSFLYYGFHFTGAGSPCYRKLTLMDNGNNDGCEE